MRKFLAVLFYDWAIGLAGSKDELNHYRKLRDFKFVIEASEKEENNRRIYARSNKKAKAKA